MGGRGEPPWYLEFRVEQHHVAHSDGYDRVTSSVPRFDLPDWPTAKGRWAR